MSFMIMAPPNSKLEFLLTHSSYQWTPFKHKLPLSGHFTLTQLYQFPANRPPVLSEQLLGKRPFNHPETDEDVY